MRRKESRGNLILPEPMDFGYVARDIRKAMDVLRRYFGVETFKEMKPDYFNKRYHGEPEDFHVHLALCRVGDLVYELI